MTTDCRAQLVALHADLVVPTRACAVRVWHDTYHDLLPAGQVEYMLALRNSEEAVGSYMDAPDRWFDVALQAGQRPDAPRVLGYTSVRLGTEPATARLEQLYVDRPCWGSGLAVQLLGCAMGRAIEAGARSIDLTVNRGNYRAQRFYARNGFTIVDELVSDIGGGYVMDDFVLSRPL